MPTELRFHPFPKIPRLLRDVTVTEKIDGTNGGIIVDEDGRVAAQSRNRLLTRNGELFGPDNYGFGAWVLENASRLAESLGPGVHMGEWWGRGIQRAYGAEGRYFSLFNTSRWGTRYPRWPEQLRIVPILYQGVFDMGKIEFVLQDLEDNGSWTTFDLAVPAEGVIIYHHHSNSMTKITLDGDGHKS